VRHDHHRVLQSHQVIRERPHVILHSTSARIEEIAHHADTHVVEKASLQLRSKKHFGGGIARPKYENEKKEEADQIMLALHLPLSFFFLCTVAAGECAPGWSGEKCTVLKGTNANYACAEGGTCLETNSTWGGNMAFDETDGKWHMFTALMTFGCSLDFWQTNSVVLHTVSESIEGPYEYSDISLGQRDTSYWDGLMAHNPTIHRAPEDGTWLLYYIGTTSEGMNSTDCRNEKQTRNDSNHTSNVSSVKDLPPPTQNQRIGLATSSSPFGPWERRDPILPLGPDGTWDSLFNTNPSVHIYPNGSALMSYKGRSDADEGSMHTGIAFASHWSDSEYQRMMPDGPFDLPPSCEDGGLYFDGVDEIFRMVLHDGCNYQTMTSINGLDWVIENDGKEIPWCNVTYTNGDFETLLRRERPEFIIDKTGRASHMTAGVMPSTSHDKQTFTMISALE